MNEFMTYRKLVKPEDLNPANRLFGGRIMEWADEAAALYAMCQMKTTSIVTLKVSEILFKNPALVGDVLEFYCSRQATGETSMTINLTVRRKTIHKNPVQAQNAATILSCEFVFVAIDPSTGRPAPHGEALPTRVI
jgi:acyl-CoA hydrolase